MINTVDRLPDKTGWFLINKSVKVKYNEDNTVDLEFNDDVTEEEALTLAEELLKETINFTKEQYG